MNRKFIGIASIVIGAMMALNGCGSKSSDSLNTGEKNSYDETVVATVNGVDVTLADFNFAYYENAAQYQQYYQYYMGIDDWESQELDGKTCGELVRENAVDEMKQLIVAQQKAKEYGIEVDSEMADEVRTQKNSVIENNFGGDEAYQEYLASYFTSDYAVEKYLQRATLLTDLYEKMSQDGEECAVDEDEAWADYEENYVKASHVLIQVSDDVTSEQALAKAQEVVSKLNAGEDMAKLIEEYGEDPGMEESDYYVFTEGEMVDEFYEAAKALEVGEYTQEPVESSYGYHVIYRHALDKTDEEYTDLLSSKSQEKFMDLLEGWTEEAQAEIDDDAIDAALAKQKEETEAAEADVDADAAEVSDEADANEEEIPEVVIDDSDAE